MSLAWARIPRRVIGSLFPACGRLVACMARGTEWGSREIFLSVSRKVVIRSSMNPSVRAVPATGTRTAVSQALAIGTSAGSGVGIGVTGWAGLRRVSAFHSLQSDISFARSVTISEKRHQVGGFGEPPKVSLSAM